MDVRLVDQVDVLGRAVVALEDLDVVFLDAGGLLDDAVVLAGDRSVKNRCHSASVNSILFSASSWARRLATSAAALVIGRYS